MDLSIYERQKEKLGQITEEIIQRDFRMEMFESCEKMSNITRKKMKTCHIYGCTIQYTIIYGRTILYYKYI